MSGMNEKTMEELFESVKNGIVQLMAERDMLKKKLAERDALLAAGRERSGGEEKQ